MTKARRFAVCDCETDPFLKDRIPVPFIWGYFDGKEYKEFTDTSDFVKFIRNKSIILYAHNGGKFDFMFLLQYVGETRAQIINGRIVSIYLGLCELRDSFAAIPEALAKFGGKKEIAYWKFEKHSRQLHMPEIREYLYYDCKSLYDTLSVYRAIAGTHKTIASNALSFARKLKIDVGKTNATFDDKYRSFYFGGRTECFRPGTHRNVRMLDIHSAYPYAMLQNHATGNAFVRGNSLDGMSDYEISRSFIVIECKSYGAFPKRTHEGLSFPHEYDEYFVTGWEYLVARDFGLIDNVKIQSVRSTNEIINFRPYVEHWYKYKNDHSEKLKTGKRKYPIEYTIGKTMMNALYGKLAQNPARYYDYKYVPAGTIIDKDNGWDLHTEFGNHEIHRRSTLWKYKNEYGMQWESKPIFNNVATGASITGFTRAHLLRAIHTIGIENAIYCDTDSIFCNASADISNLPQSNVIGDWENEGIATIGHFAGKKLYGLDLGQEKSPDERYKIACKGSKLSFQEIEKIISGETVTWENKAPTFHIDGKACFIVRSISATHSALQAT